MSEFLSDRIGKEAVEFIEDCNASQGADSYNFNEKSLAPSACHTKILRLRAQGIDVRDFATFEEYYAAATKKGYYLGLPNVDGHPKDQYENIGLAFNDFKNGSRKDVYDQRYREMIRYNAGLQIALENCAFTGNDRKKRSVILMRTESEDVITVNGVMPKIREKCQHLRGVNESHSVWQTVSVYGGELTMIRVPYSRINGLYMLKSHNPFMYAGEKQNEISADTHGLPAYLVAHGVEKDIQVEKFMPTFLAAEKFNP